jgi:transposase
MASAAGGRRRRKHSAEFKAQLVQACEQPGMSSAAIAMANGINANLLRRWVKEAGPCGSSMTAPLLPSTSSPPPTQKFIPLQLPALNPQADIRIELQRSGISVSVVWPVSAAADCATWLREVLG